MVLGDHGLDAHRSLSWFHRTQGRFERVAGFLV
ncbi:hypothetical protein F1D05_36370 [Kribbella qitaiheensis]|uniref:Uncharacterized protein n=1 Tax=Kribbella qitaiheensis TaxID=1544730 RepID=A0A7G6X811_9ACTN|nr:hypothetical protein F1D05_36370 [Kribbella qitaiheensis]